MSKACQLTPDGESESVTDIQYTCIDTYHIYNHTYIPAHVYVLYMHIFQQLFYTQTCHHNKNTKGAINFAIFSLEIRDCGVNECWMPCSHEG